MRKLDLIPGAAVVVVVVVVVVVGLLVVVVVVVVGRFVVVVVVVVVGGFVKVVAEAAGHVLPAAVEQSLMLRSNACPYGQSVSCASHHHMTYTQS